MSATPARDAVVKGLADHGCCFDDVLAAAMVDALLNEAFTAFAERITRAYEGHGPDEDNWIITPYDVAALARGVAAPASE